MTDESFNYQVDDGFHSDGGGSGLESPPPQFDDDTSTTKVPNSNTMITRGADYEHHHHQQQPGEQEEEEEVESVLYGRDYEYDANDDQYDQYGNDGDLSDLSKEAPFDHNGGLIINCDAQRVSVLSYEQVRKLTDVMDDVLSIHGRGNFPTIEVRLKDLVALVRNKLEMDVSEGGAGMNVRDIRLNGGAASHVLATDIQSYNDLDLIFAVEFSSTRHFDRVKSAVLNALFDLLPEGVSRRRITQCSLKEAYVGKMVKVNNNDEGDRWSLISLGNSPGHKNVELKFVDKMKRQFEFSVDSFQIILDSLLLFCAQLPISENCYPTVLGESVYGDFQEALYHLHHKLIATRQPEEIRGGGLLKYCNLLVRNYRPLDSEHIKTLERYMCSRFFIDFTDINTQISKLEGYLRAHFWGTEDEHLQYQYLMYLYDVVETSTICLMGRERRQSLTLIENLAMQILCKEQQKQQQQQQSAANTTTTLSYSSHLLTSTPVTTVATAATSVPQQPQTIATNVQTTTTSPPPLLYANGVYYAPVIPTPFCTCNSHWLTTTT